MKYINLNKYKFFKIIKHINRIRYNFFKLFKSLNLKSYGFKNFYKFFSFKKHQFRKFYKYPDIRIYNFRKFYKYLDIRIYNFRKFYKFFGFKYHQKTPIYFATVVIFIGFLYLFTPIFYSYDKSKIENIICNDQSIKCVIDGKIKYKFYPTPRIKITNLIIKDTLKKENILLKSNNVIIKISIKNLLDKKKHNFTKIKLSNFEINFNVANLKKYKNIFKKKANFIPVSLSKGKIVFFDGKNYIATIDEVNSDLMFKTSLVETSISGKFLNDDIRISINSEQVDNQDSIKVILKMPKLKLITKAYFFDLKKDEKNTSGNIFIKLNKNKLKAVFDYKDNQVIIRKSQLSNAYANGTIQGKINFLPYFIFDLDVNLNNINFTKLYNSFLALDKKKQQKIFQINNKINGNLILSSDKIYSNYNLIESFESRVEFINGSILIEQLLLNLGKLGAADLLGSINNDGKINHFKFESNVFVDNQKKFLSKFGIYKKRNISSNFFVSGNLDFNNQKITFYEVLGNKKINKENIVFMEKEFNSLLLEDGYKNLFHFPKFKEFIKIIMTE